MASFFARKLCTAIATKQLLPSRVSPVTSASFSTLKTASRARQPVTRVPKQTFLKKALPRAAAFHATAKRDILPPLPQRLEGTANEAAPVPTPNSSHGAYHWTFERSVAVALIPLTVAPFASGSLNPTLDAALCVLLVAHSHVGFQSCIIDYFPKKRVPKTRLASEWALRIASLLTIIGLYEFETNDVGLTEGVRRIWKASAQ